MKYKYKKKNKKKVFLKNFQKTYMEEFYFYKIPIWSEI